MSVRSKTYKTVASMYVCRMQSQLSDIEFSDNLWFSDYFSIYYIKSFDLVTLRDLVTVFAETKNVTKSRLHYNFMCEGGSVEETFLDNS